MLTRTSVWSLAAYWFGPQSQREGPWVAPLFTAGNLFYLGTHQAWYWWQMDSCSMRSFACGLAGKFALHLLHCPLCVACTAAILTYMAGKKGHGKPSLLRHLITAYMVITGIVEASPQSGAVPASSALLAAKLATAHEQVVPHKLLVTNLCCRSRALYGTSLALVSIS